MLCDQIVVGKIHGFRETSRTGAEQSRYYGGFRLTGIIETAPVGFAVFQQRSPRSKSRRRWNLRLARCEGPDAVLRNTVALSGGDQAI